MHSNINLTHKIFADLAKIKGEEYSFFIKVGQRDCILALSTDSEACVESVRLTTLYNETAMSEDSKAAIFNYYILLCSVLTSRPADEITQLLSKYSADYNSVDFTDNSIEAEAEKYNCFIYTNGQFISLHCTLL